MRLKLQHPERRNMRRNMAIMCMCVCVCAMHVQFSRYLIYQCNKLNAAIVLVGQSICCLRRRHHCRRRREKKIHIFTTQQAPITFRITFIHDSICCRGKHSECIVSVVQLFTLAGPYQPTAYTRFAHKTGSIGSSENI